MKVGRSIAVTYVPVSTYSLNFTSFSISSIYWIIYSNVVSDSSNPSSFTHILNTWVWGEYTISTTPSVMYVVMCVACKEGLAGWLIAKLSSVVMKYYILFRGVKTKSSHQVRNLLHRNSSVYLSHPTSLDTLTLYIHTHNIYHIMFPLVCDVVYTSWSEHSKRTVPSLHRTLRIVHLLSEHKMAPDPSPQDERLPPEPYTYIQTYYSILTHTWKCKWMLGRDSNGTRRRHNTQLQPRQFCFMQCWYAYSMICTHESVQCTVWHLTVYWLSTC